MGADKALMEFEGLPLIEHAINLLQRAGLAVSVACGTRKHLENRAHTVNDLGSSEGPLGGVCGALEVTRVTWTIFIPVDLPLLPAALLARLLTIAQVTGDPVVVPSVNGFPQRFPAVVHLDALPALRSELLAGHRGCFAAYGRACSSLGKSIRVIATELLVQTGQVRHPRGLPAASWFLNVNSPSDFAHARSFTTRFSPEQSHFA